MRLVLPVLSLALLCGCVGTDPNTMYVLDRRLSDLETGRRSQASQPQARQAQHPQQRDGLNYVTLYVPLKNGGYYPVRITQAAANVFMGPNGELYYYNVPTVAQLKDLYPPK